MGRTKITAKNGCIGVVINIILSIGLSKVIGIKGVSLASSIAMIVTSILLLYNIVKLIGKINIKMLFNRIIKITLSAVVMTIILLIVSNFTKNINSYVNLIAGILIGSFVYFACMYMFKIPELKELINIRKIK